MSVIARLDQIRAAGSVLEHPFYRRWSAGELTAGELGRYAGEYRHAVLALAEASERAAAKAPPAHAQELRAHAEEEATHVALWDDFAEAAGARARAHDEPAHEETVECVRAWTAGEDTLEHLAVLYAIEASQPEVSRTKLEGLLAHYGYAEEGPAVEYFRTHELRDVEHAREAGALIERLIASVADPQRKARRLEELAEGAVRGNWSLLDGVQERAPR